MIEAAVAVDEIFTTDTMHLYTGAFTDQNNITDINIVCDIIFYEQKDGIQTTIRKEL